MKLLYFTEPKQQNPTTAILGMFESRGWIYVTSYPNDDIPVVELKPDLFEGYVDHVWYENLFRKVMLLRRTHTHPDFEGYEILIDWLYSQVTNVLEPFRAGLEDVAFTMIQGAAKHDPPDRWKNLPYTEHRDHMRDHIKADEEGDKDEDHAAHAAARALMMLVQRNKKI